MKTRTHEILAPAGDEECLKAAVGAGADAIYFGLNAGFNARAKAPSFGPDELPRVFDYLHERGVKGYVTFNTVVFDSELALAEELLAVISASGADAILVQDLGVARLARAVVPDLPLHASTQMTISSPEAAAIAVELGVSRIVLPRELSVKEIRRFREHTPAGVELECFVHGALCVSYSGQCLTSEAWGQRSANRGQCAQSCRLAYELVVDGKRLDKGVERYLLSPRDLAAHNLLADLVEAGIVSFKIEGRYKGPDYVAGAVEKYRRALDAVLAGQRPELTLADREDLAFTFSRGFSTGWLEGDDHRALNHGLYPGHRGLLVGTVADVRGYRVLVRLAPGAPALKAGDWMVFGQGDPEGDEPAGGLFGVGASEGGVLEVRFGDPGPELSKVHAGDELWKSHDPTVKKRLLRYVDAERRVPVDVVVRGRLGEPLLVEAADALGRRARVQGPVLEQARTRPLDAGIVKEKLASFGGSRWELGRLTLELEGALATSPAALKQVRRELIAALEAQALPKPTRRRVALDIGELGAEPSPPLTPSRGGPAGPPSVEGAPDEWVETRPVRPVNVPFALTATPTVIPLCRTLEQVDAALAVGARDLYADMMELVGLRDAVKRCKQAGARVAIATMRIQKPGEEPIDESFERLAPDGILARHLGALEHYRRQERPGFALHGDFSLNCTNAVTGRTLLGLGLDTLTPSYDLNLEQLEELARGLPSERLEVTVHQHLPLYHTEYCLYAHNLSSGHNFEDCGRPCETHRAHLRDVKGQEHPVLVDVHCRNTIFNAQAQSAARQLGRILAMGVRRLRVELVWESAAETRRVLEAYGQLVRGTASPARVLETLGAVERYGVTAGTLQVMSRPALKVVG